MCTPAAVLDDTCKTMHGTQAGLEVDKKFLDTARQLHTSNAHFRPVPNAFVVKHYAGEVTVSVPAVRARAEMHNLSLKPGFCRSLRAS
jgi:myosin heavy subunit